MTKYLCDPEVLKWIRGVPDFIPGKTKKARSAAEMLWGQHKSNSTNEKWSGEFGERLVRELYPNGWVPAKRKNGRRFDQLDWETDDFVIEVKTQCFFNGGTAQDKILGVPVKYRNMPAFYGKPLRIICVANAEFLTKDFFKHDDKIATQLDLWKSWGITYHWMSDLLSTRGTEQVAKRLGASCPPSVTEQEGAEAPSWYS
jgi:hypothetical protein